MFIFKLWASFSPSSVIPSGIFHLRVPESASVGSAVGRIRAYDLDAGISAEVDYAIVPGDEGNMFDIISDRQSQEGVVVLKKVQLIVFNCCSCFWHKYINLTAAIWYELQSVGFCFL